MIENDTVRLLRECDAGIKMGVAAIDGVLGHTHDKQLRHTLHQNKEQHAALQEELDAMLRRCHDRGKNPSVMARSMSVLKINAMLAWHPTDRTVADLLTDGCNMGMKSLHRYLNQYPAADTQSKQLAQRIIALEQSLSSAVTPFL